MIQIEDNGDLIERDEKHLLAKLKVEALQNVEKAVGADRSSLSVTEICDYSIKSNLEHFCTYGAGEQARKLILEDCREDEIKVRYGYTPTEWEDAALLAYLADPEAYAEQEAAAYIDGHQEFLLAAIIKYEALLSAYQCLADNPGHQIHLVKRVQSAVRASEAKSVHVTIVKNGTIFTFVTGAQALCADCQSTYDTYRLAARDRSEYERRFGSEGYLPKEILRVTYKGKAIYEADSQAVSEQESEVGKGETFTRAAGM